MALVVNDRVKETTTTTGTGTLDLGGASTGFETFVAGIGTTNTTYYCIDDGAGNFEVGIGTVTDAATDTLSRDTVLSSSNSDALVNFGAGTKDVFCTLPASKAVIGDSSGDVTITGDIFPGANDTYDLGSLSNVWRNVYTGDLHLSNEVKKEGNKVDGTKGSWTIQEGSDDLYLLNNKSGKKYKFKLEEV